MSYLRPDAFIRCRDAYEGLDALRAKASTYLLTDLLFANQGSNTQLSRELYVMAAPYYNIFTEDVCYAKDTLRTEMREITYESFPRDDLAPSASLDLARQFENMCTRNNLSFQEITENILEHILVVGSVFAFLDPNENTEENLLDADNRLTLRFIPVDEITEFSYDGDGNLNWVRFSKSLSEVINGQVVITQRTYDIFSQPYRVVTSYSDERESQTTILTLRGRTSDQIMGGMYGADGINTGGPAQLSIFYDMCNLSLNLYLANAIATFNAAKAAFVIPVFKRAGVAGTPVEQQAQPPGGGFIAEFIQIDSTEELELVEITGQGITVFMNQVRATSDQAFSKAITPRVNDLRSNTSGRSVGIAMGRTKTILNRLSNGVDRMQTDILNKFLEWYGIPYKARSMGNKEFVIDSALEEAQRTETNMRSQDQEGTR